MAQSTCAVHLCMCPTVHTKGARCTAMCSMAGHYDEEVVARRFMFILSQAVDVLPTFIPAVPAQNIFEEDDRVLFISLHQAGNYPIASGEDLVCPRAVQQCVLPYCDGIQDSSTAQCACVAVASARGQLPCLWLTSIQAML